MLSLVLFLISVLIGRKREKKLLSQTVQEDLTEPASVLQDEPADDGQPGSDTDAKRRYRNNDKSDIR